MTSVKKNFFYSSFITVSNYIFPLLTYPYVSRVLGVTNIGICNYVDSIINWFSLFSMMGIGIIGIREIAGTNLETRKKTFSSLLVLNFLTTLVALIGLVICVFALPKLHDYKNLLFVGMIKLISNVFVMDWLYKGLEDFKYITKISITSKFLYVICVFIFVRDVDDYPIYYILSVSMIFFTAVFNSIHSRSIVSFSFKELSLNKYLRPLLLLGFYAFFTSMYTSFNVAFLGYTNGPEQVGYYTTSNKLFSVIIAFFTAFTGVMLPRMSSLVAEDKMEQFKVMLNKSLMALLSFSVPIIIFSVIYSPSIVKLFTGNGFEGAYTPSRIVMPLMLIIGLEQIYIIQVLMPLKKDSSILINSFIGAGVGVFFNFLLVPYSGAIGSSITWALSELSVLIASIFCVHRYLKVPFPFYIIVKTVICYLPLFVLLVVIYKYVLGVNFLLEMIISFAIMAIYAFIVEFKLMRNEMLISVFERFKVIVKDKSI